jgi:hypothetical protein
MLDEASIRRPIRRPGYDERQRRSPDPGQNPRQRDAASARLTAEGESQHDQRERQADEQNERQPGAVLMRKLQSAQADVPPLGQRLAQPAEDVR